MAAHLEEERTAENDDGLYVSACVAKGGFPAANAELGRQALAANGAGQTTKRPVRPISIRDLKPAPIATAAPSFVIVDPASLIIEGSYQRHLSGASRTLVRKIVATWDWRRFKPPVVAKTPAGLEVIDGQHTAIAAASHPAIDRIPVMVVEAVQEAERAGAFIGHNRDRIGMTPMQLHFAALVAGDAHARSTEAVCAAAGAKILRTTPGHGTGWQPGETVAVNAIRALFNRRGQERATEILAVLVRAGAAPISAAQIKAVEMLLCEGEYAGQIEPSKISATIRAMGETADQEAKVFAAAHGIPAWRALGVILFKNRNKRRAAGEGAR
jgi:hypothetical protein